MNLIVFLFVSMLFCVPAAWSGTSPQEGPAQQKPEDVFARAHALAIEGERQKALNLLSQALALNPAHGDLRFLYGLVLSWEGRYDEARTELQRVVGDYPKYLDAWRALIRVEWWSGRLKQAERLSGRALRTWPEDTQLLLLRARILQALGRQRQARDALGRLLALEPGNSGAREMRRDIEDASRRWNLSLNHATEWFNDNRNPWNESYLELERSTGIGPVIGRLSRAHRFSRRSDQFEVDFYPQITRRTYLYLNAGHSPDERLYPAYRAGAEIYQQLVHNFRVSAGYRRLDFANPVNVYTVSVGKYHGNWLFSARAYEVPALLGESRTLQFSARRFFGGGAHYAEIRYSTGAASREVRSINDVEVLESDAIDGELRIPLSRRWTLRLRAGYSAEDRVERSDLQRLLLGGGLYFQF